MAPNAPRTDLEIAQSVRPLPIAEVAARLGIGPAELEPYGHDKAKLPLSLIPDAAPEDHRLILVTAITPTPAGEGKTTVSIGLTDGLNRIGRQAAVALREPSLGPVFGIKGGAAGGGRSQVIPMVDINLHFTGDFAAIEKANNLLAALVDNHLHHRKPNPRIDPRTVTWKRVMDMNERSLRRIVTGLGGATGGVPRESGFHITAASEVMAILCLSRDREDLKRRLGDIYLGDTMDREPVYARDLGAQGAMAVLLREAIKPNLVQTLEGNPAILHGGPFANIAQGTNSILATRMALGRARYAVTEAGFGADLGAEKFLHIKCRAAGLSPHAVVLTATIRALKYHGGVAVADLGRENPGAVRAGLPNLEKHVENLRAFGLPVVVALNAFATDSEAERQAVFHCCAQLGVPCVPAEGWARGGEGMEDLARAVVEAAETAEGPFRPMYEPADPMPDKIRAIATRLYGASAVRYTPEARRDLRRIERLGLGGLPVCMAKTAASLSDDHRRVGRPVGFDLTVREVEIAAGAGFVIPITGGLMRMPGLPKEPAALGMDVDAAGSITGLS
jgi:formate--tetrahydrofolate ligase